MRLTYLVSSVSLLEADHFLVSLVTLLSNLSIIIYNHFMVVGKFPTQKDHDTNKLKAFRYTHKPHPDTQANANWRET